MFVIHRFHLNQYTKDLINDMEPKFGYDGFGEVSFYRTYSRYDWDTEKQEHWPDVVIRVIEGTFSIRKDWYLKTGISWDEKYWQDYAHGMAISLFKMEWMPAGRGLFIMGTKFMYERGGMALYNCSYGDVYFDKLHTDSSWIMDCLMLGVGVGFSPFREDGFQFKNPQGTREFVIPDRREGWTEGWERLFRAYMYGEPKPKFIYDEIRPEGTPIKGFGGIASGPKPLKVLYEFTEEAINKYMADAYYDSVLFKTDIENEAGCCVVAGNVRRSAEGTQGPIYDLTYLDLKNYDRFPERATRGWMSNNSVILEKDEDFDKLPEIARRIVSNGEPGFINLRNFPYGRIGKRKEKVKKDKGRNCNPCFEIILQDKEVCNIAETCPTVCNDSEKWLKACEYATLYCSTVSLLPTHQPATNKVVARNRRIGVSIIDFTGWVHNDGLSNVTKYLRKGYKKVTKINREVNAEAGIPESIRKTTIKPGGTTPKLPGKTSGGMYPNFHYMVRRMRIARNSPIHSLLVEANIPYENDLVSANSDVFELPIKMNTDVPQAGNVSVWQQAMNLIILQREWADNAVSNTLNFRPKWVLIKHFQDGDIESKLKDELIDNGYIPYYYEIEKDLSNKDVYEDSVFKITVKWDNNYNEMTEAKVFKFDPRHEEDYIEAVLAAIAPVTKTVSMLPHTSKGVYAQMPEEGITEEEYHQRLSLIKKIDWSKLKGSEGIDERYCSGESCERV